MQVDRIFWQVPQAGRSHVWGAQAEDVSMHPLCPLAAGTELLVRLQSFCPGETNANQLSPHKSCLSSSSSSCAFSVLAWQGPLILG